MNKRKTGAEYERFVADYLKQKGYRILEQNYRTASGEIDLIAEEADGTLVFCEIKYRSSSVCGMPQEAVNGKKQRRISKTALHYYAYHGYAEGRPCRFDVISIYGDDGQVTHLKNAFEFQG